MQTGVVESVHTDDLDEARAVVAGAFCPHGLSAATDERLDVDFSGFRSEAFSVVRLDYGTAVRIDPARWDSFYLVQVPLTGRAVVHHGREEVRSTSDVAAVLSPDAPVSMRWDAATPQLILYLERDVVLRRVGAMLGREVTTAPRFEPALAWSDPGAAAWSRLLAHVAGEIAHDSPLLRDQGWLHLMGDLLTDQLLTVQRHTYTDELAGGRPLGSRAVRAARALIEQESDQPLTVVDLADRAGVSVRTLQEGFRRELGVSPTQHLRERRLVRAHELLLEGDPSTTSVTEIALSQGFTHLGRFSGSYQRRYGCTPSSTLRSAVRASTA